MNEEFTDFIEASGLLTYDPETISKIYQKTGKDYLKDYGKLFFQYLLTFFLLDGIKLQGD